MAKLAAVCYNREGTIIIFLALNSKKLSGSSFLAALFFLPKT